MKVELEEVLAVVEACIKKGEIPEVWENEQRNGVILAYNALVSRFEPGTNPPTDRDERS